MDLGLGNLSDVKAFVLPPDLVGTTQYDSVLATIAAGVAGSFEAYCNRNFKYVANDVVEFDARRTFYILPRYPVYSIAALAMNDTTQDDWTDILSTIVQEDFSIGWIYFGCYVGDPICMVRATYTGGFWYETLEPLQADGVTPTVGYPSTQPAGTKGVPPSLKNAWLNQVLHEFQLKDRLLPESLVGVNAHKGAAWRLDQAILLPRVDDVLKLHRRMQLVV